MVLDTSHFDKTFTDKLLAELSQVAPLDEQLDGLLVHGENFQALNLLQAQYRGRVKCVYIDPPYNTAASAILYKNDYKDSCWLSLMHDRVLLSKNMMSSDGIICCAIDDEEVSVLRGLMENIFAEELGIVAVRSNPAGRKTKNRFAPAHEYALFYGKTEKSVPGALPKTEAQLRGYPNQDDKGRFVWTNLVRSGSNDRRQDSPKLFYPIFVNNKNGFRIPTMVWDENKRAWVTKESEEKTETVILPIRTVGDEGNWHRGWKRLVAEPSEYRIRRAKSGKVLVEFKKRMDENSLPKTWWEEGKYSSANGTLQLKHVLGDNEFNFPKSVGLVEDCIRSAASGNTDACILDYFAGSGTTAHAVLNLNRADKGKRKYILLELGHHFDTVLLPRIKKIVYASEWKNGAPKNPNKPKGVSQLVKYIRLESYEDTLDSLTMTPRDDLLAKAELDQINEEYQLRYALGAESENNAALLGGDFTDPFNCTLSVVRDGARRDVRVDLVETFNFLLGMRVARRNQLGDVLALSGRDGGGESVLVLWRNLTKTNAKQLDKWFNEHRALFAENELTRIYTNGDHTLNALKQSNDYWGAQTIEPLFRELMFAETNNAGA